MYAHLDSFQGQTLVLDHNKGSLKKHDFPKPIKYSTQFYLKSVYRV